MDVELSHQGLDISRQKIVEDVVVIPAELCGRTVLQDRVHTCPLSSQTKTESSHHLRTDTRTMQGRIQHVV